MLVSIKSVWKNGKTEYSPARLHDKSELSALIRGIVDGSQPVCTPPEVTVWYYGYKLVYNPTIRRYIVYGENDNGTTYKSCGAALNKLKAFYLQSVSFGDTIKL